MNSTGARPYKAVDVTDDIFTLGLPEGVLELIPIVPPKMSELGEINEGLVASVSAAISDYAGFVWNGICAIGEFLESVGSYVAEIGLAVLGTIWDALSAIGDAVVSALNVLVDYIVGIFKQAISILIKPVLNAIDNWAKRVAEVINETFSDFSTQSLLANGSGAAETNGESSSLYEMVFGGRFFYTILTLCMGLQAALGTVIALSTATGTGIVASLVSATAKDYLVGMLVGMLMSAATISLEGFVIIPALKAIVGDDDFFEEGIGLSLIGMIPGFVNLIIHKLAGKPLITDAIGLGLALIGLLISSSVTEYLHRPVIGTLIALTVALIGLFLNTVWGKTKTDWIDRTGHPLSLTEETITLVIVAYNTVALLDNI